MISRENSRRKSLKSKRALAIAIQTKNQRANLKINR
jgi:hypothetical protein